MAAQAVGMATSVLVGVLGTGQHPSRCVLGERATRRGRERGNRRNCHYHR